MSSAEILALISIFVSIIGWYVTYKRQKSILELQINAEIEKEKNSLFLSVCLEDIEKIYNWTKKGFRLLDVIRSEKTEDNENNAITMHKQWGLDYREMLHIAYYLEKRSVSTSKNDAQILSSSLNSFYRGISGEFNNKIINENQKDMDEVGFLIDSGYDVEDRLENLRREFLNIKFD